MLDNYRKYFIKGMTKSEFEGNDIYYIKDYYPKNRYSRVPAAINEVRNMIYDFKDGRRDFSELITDSLKQIIQKKGEAIV